MSERNDDCYFTGVPDAEYDFDFDQDLTYVRSKAFKNLYMKMSPGNLPMFEQTKANCARKIVDILNDNPKAVAAWTTRDNVENLKQYFMADRKHVGKVRVVCAYEDSIEEVVDHSAKPMLLLESFAKRLSTKSAYSKFKIGIEDRIWARIADDNEMMIIVNALLDGKFIRHEMGNFRPSTFFTELYHIEFIMTVKGWEQIADKKTASNTNKVFIATQFLWPDKEEEIRVKAIEAIKAACKSLGYDANIAPQNHTENITDKIITEIKNSRFVIAELTYNNRGVYYEAGYARGIGKQVFHLVRKGFTEGAEKEAKRIHFDIEQIMYRVWNEPEDLEVTLREWIEAAQGKFR